MAVYAAIVSLMNTIEQIKNHPRFSTFLEEYQIESLSKNLDFLLDFVENNNSHGGIRKEELEDLESQIASMAFAAEDVIESHIVDQIFFGTIEKSHFLLNLQKLIEGLDLVKEKVVKVKEKSRFKDQLPTYSVPTASSRVLSIGKTTMVGFDGYLMQLLEGLTGQQSNRYIIPIVGMGGIGKTTLARNVYENSLIMQHFDVRAWVSVSQQYNVRKILLETLSCLKESTMNEKDEWRLGEQLYKVLSGRRYLIILDDMWSDDIWNKIKFFFPNNYNRSRIIVTTRLADVANHLGSLRVVVDFLNDEESWSLFCEKVFGQGDCPLELEKIGKKIVKKCKGLPLSIVVIGGLLSKSAKTQQHWENVSKDISLVLNMEEKNQCLNIVSLSYIHLSSCLKPCFLYLGIFPEDHDIKVSQLTKLWVAEGFIKPNKDRSLEEVAEGYINDLIDRNLILVCSLRSDGKVKSFNIHDLVRDLCLSIAEKKKFFHVMRDFGTPHDVDIGRRIIIDERIKEEHPTQVTLTSESARSLICLGEPVSSDSKLLRVFVVINSDSPHTGFRHVNLRFLSAKYVTPDLLYSSIFLFWNLQTLIITSHNTDIPGESARKLVAPHEIWEMRWLRHLELDCIGLPCPTINDTHDRVVLQNLQTLKTVLDFGCTEEVCKRIPNIMKLNIVYEEDKVKDEMCTWCIYNDGLLEKLESLTYNFSGSPNRVDLLQNLMFPNSLKKLSLQNCGIEWKDLNIIGLLPRLEVLKLKYRSVRGHIWNPVEGEFCRLRFLGIYSCSDLIYWNAESFHFPILENLVLFGLFQLDEIPSGVGEIPTLDCISLDECSVSAAISSVKILEEQGILGNQGPRVRIEFWDNKKHEDFREKVEQEGLTNLNFQLF